MTGKSVTCTRSTRPAAISARFIDRLPCERNGTSDSSLSRATTSTASPLTTVAFGQSRGSSQRRRHHRRRQVHHPRDPRVTHLGLLGARGQHLHERPERVRPEDHPLLRVVQGEAVVEQLGALLAPVAGPVGAGGAVAVEAGEDVEGVGSGHGGAPATTARRSPLVPAVVSVRSRWTTRTTVRFAAAFVARLPDRGCRRDLGPSSAVQHQVRRQRRSSSRRRSPAPSPQPTKASMVMPSDACS